MSGNKPISLVQLCIRSGIKDPAKSVKKCTAEEMKRLQHVVSAKCKQEGYVPAWTKLNKDVFQNGNPTPKSREAISKIAQRFLPNNDGRVTILELVLGMVKDAQQFTQHKHMVNWQ